MKIDWPQSGKYVIAVSGGVDSMALMHMMSQREEYDLVIAHFNHGWRPEAREEAELVRATAERLGLSFRAATANTPDKTEAGARQQRYAFLHKVMDDAGASAVITAHHWDDLQETAIFNTIRGTGRHGLSPLDGRAVLRPLLGIHKSELQQYAMDHAVSWIVDTSNGDTRYSRNQVRNVGLPAARQEISDYDDRWASLIMEARDTNISLDRALEQWLVEHAEVGERQIRLPIDQLRRCSLELIQEIVHFSMRSLDPGVEVTARTLADLAVHTKTGRLHAERRLSSQLFAQARYGTLTIAVRHL